ncbi:MAG: phenylalanyl-tRNA synthetase beta subunit [uncultured bacterium]|uniref:Phenylalanine--tRNA ligase beta subunit n=1 Tax=Candidatus Daviesbacteria bacterium GW2011_GWC2_40_12 TaxID=1618431 RepID=A0A0G0TT21_9BACT|nr:MAG: phenylalanyl-tRNA synthetase beta subunit [uncultured bacterium]KKR16670.1 MAG: Phenylalanine-tRNA ligase beta subunit [Candidatus Daviesbacteria bacterium GW2011_GWA2_39_33]KKR25136.1 MAG: Phenylalanine-tRNA ligase beta subunit [Candidatus Daviesbacteria bacterium GW2011_GWB1_39_5]KKR41047.1 MAG: Phenylalanine-tRNA ligase beta subunit [Candidatus Daviesbacteria bacterium GW2011_GWC2_40_12]OGE21226.1 MAG: phenylalanine--tRNA ligase subunit beta [Candidatus Daviesbacteria bacterium RIFCS
MKVSIKWLKELVDLKTPVEELVRLLPLRTIGTKEVTDNFIELDMKGYNRADLLSLRGVALEAAAITNSPTGFKPAVIEQITYDADFPKVNISVEDEKLCPVYCLAKIEGLKVKPTAQEEVKKLEDSGMRTVNNVADVTNLVMLEYGQPMHAFDAEKVRGCVKVRVAKENEKITTLDGKIRDLNKEDLLIGDENEPIGIAGVMGGKDSEISENTTSILLEAAIFDPISLRKSSLRHGLYSEASRRFQHGLTKTNLLQALSTAIKMYEKLGGKLTAITLTGDLKDEVKKVKLSQSKINSLIGVEIPPNEVESSLKKLGFTLEKEGQDWEVTVPYWRMDIDIEEDLIEEVARMYGYEKIPPKELEGEMPQKIDQSFPKFIYDLKKALKEAGLTEVQTYSFYSSKTINDLRLTIYDLIKISNPISSETEYMRDNLWPNLLEVTAINIKQGYKDIAIFEIGKVYILQKGDLPKEQYRLSIALSNGTTNPVEELYRIFQGVNLPHFQGVQLSKSVTLTQKEYFHPTRFQALEDDGQTIGFIAEIHPRFVNKFGTEQRIAALEVKLVL